MTRYQCHSCGEQMRLRRLPAACPNCDRIGTLVACEPDRDRDEDDGRSGYSDPRDARAERRNR